MAIIIGNQSFNGNSVSIINNKVIIDGIDVTGQLPEQKQYNIEVHGNLKELKADVCQIITVKGTVNTISTKSGDIECRDVKGSINTMSGDVDCNDVGGSISTMSGKIKHCKQ